MKKVVINIKYFIQINKIKVKLFKGIKSFINQNIKDLLFNIAFNIHIIKIPIIIKLSSY